MSKKQPKTFKLNRIAVAVMLATASPAAIQLAHAGAGWGDSALFDGTPVKRPTFYANSPQGTQPDVSPTAGTGATRDTGTALRKFVDALPRLTPAGANTLGQYLPVAVADTTTYPGSAYYEIAIVEYTEKMHSDLAKATTLRGYVQIDPAATDTAAGLSNGALAPAGSQAIPLTHLDGITPVLISRPNGAGGFVQVQAYAVDKPHYLGPVIVAVKGTPTRIKFYNGMPAGLGDGTNRNGDLFIPTDRTLFGAGDGPGPVTGNKNLLDSASVMGPYGPTTLSDGTISPYNVDTTVPLISVPIHQQYTQNREELHLHGGDNAWVSDGHPHQWIAPAADELNSAVDANYRRGEIAYNVPDMPEPGPGAVTYFWPNGQSGRFMFYHDHATGLTRLNVYVGAAAGYLLTDPTERALMGGALPTDEIPLVIQDKTFVPKDIAIEDANWDITKWGQEGDLWFPHVYETNQDPDSIDGTNPVGRWDWGAYFWPVFPSNYALPDGTYGNESTTPEAFMDTPIVNGTAYPTLTVEPKAYRFRILNAANDRMLNLGLYVAANKNTPLDGVTRAPLTDTSLASNGVVSYSQLCDGTAQVAPADCTEVSMLPFDTSHAFPTSGGLMGTGWGQADNRVGGIPDPATAGPDIIQIGSEGGLHPRAAVIPSTPINYEYNKRSVTVLNVLERGMWMGPAERTDVVIDFSQYAGKTLILYNDSPAPVPAGDPRLDYYTGDGDNSAFGGAPNTQPGFGPNTRTVMQIVVGGTPQTTTANATGATPGTLRNNANNPYLGYAGSAITIASPVTVSQLGRWNISGNGAVHTVKLVDGTGVDVPGASVSITMAAASAGGFQYASLPAPVTLPAGNYYLVSSEDTTAPAGDAFYDLNTSVTTGGTASISSAVWLSGPGTNVGGATNVWNPIGGAGNSYGPVDFKYNVGTAVTPFDVNALQAALGGATGAYATTQHKPIVPETAYNVAFPGIATTDTLARIYTGAIYLNRYQGLSFTTPEPISYTKAPTCNSAASCLTAINTIRSAGLTTAAAGTAVNAYVESKAIQELFEADYGRMNATLGVELPFTSALTQTTIPLAYVDPATETIADGETQFWKITHNGVDSHPVHFHLLNVQVINRIGWDGTIKAPLADEIGWRETVKMHPLEDIVVAVRAKTPPIPFGLPHSYRLNAPNLPVGDQHGFTQVDPVTGNPAVVANQWNDYKSEYVWHCHILGHEENDFMRPFLLDAKEVLPPAFTVDSATLSGTTVTVAWTDPTPPVAANLANPANEIGFRVERSLNGGAFAAVGVAKSANVITEPTNALANASSLTDTVAAATAPAAPVLSTGAVTSTSVALSWGAVANASGYNVYRDASTTPLNAAPLTTTSFTDTGLTASTLYQYRVEAIGASANYSYRVVAVSAAGGTLSSNTQAVSLAGTNTASNTVSVTTQAVVTGPVAPSNVAIQRISANSATVSWTDNSTNEASFQVQSSTNGGATWGTVATVTRTGGASTGTGATVTANVPVNNTTNALYRVVAVQTAALTTPSVAPYASLNDTVAPVAATIGSVTATRLLGNFGLAAVNWTDNANNNVTYTVQRCTGALTTCTPAAAGWSNQTTTQGANATTWTQLTTARGVTYSYRVIAVNSAGSTTSAAAQVTTP